MANNSHYTTPAQFQYVPQQEPTYQQVPSGLQVPVASQFHEQKSDLNNFHTVANNNMPIYPQFTQVSHMLSQPLHMPTQPVVPPVHQRSTIQSEQTNDMSTISNETYDTGSEPDETTTKTNEWQCITSNKRKRAKIQVVKNTYTNIPQQNKYEPLANITNISADSENAYQSKIPKPPPIFVHGVTDYTKMVEALQDIVEIEQYKTKTMANNVVKINANTVDTYRKLVKFMKESNIIHHTYQLKEDKAYRVVIRNIHHTVPLADIKEALKEEGFLARNIVNIIHRGTKLPLPMFYVDLEPADNNKDIYNLKLLNNHIIKVEPPRKSTSLVQCTRCQQYNHTQAYCTLPYKCVKCGNSHDTRTCKKDRNTPAKCALCNGNHPANYRGCRVHKELQNKIRQGMQQTPTRPVQPSQPQHQDSHGTNVTSQQNYRTYSQIVSGQQSNNQNEDITLHKFLEEFKIMFNQLVQQNNMVLQMLSTVINKLINND